MIAILMDTLFEPVEETTLGLVALFEICADGRHVLLTNPTWKKSPRVAMALENICKAVSVPWRLRHHRLERRSIENYLPRRALDGGAHKLDQLRDRGEQQAYRRLVESYMKLGDRQRHFYNMKEGLLGDVVGDKAGDKKKPAGDKRKEYRETGAPLREDDLPSLFQNLDHHDREALRKGFGGNVASLFQDKDGVAFVQDADLQAEVSRDERDRLATSLFERM